MYDAKNEIDLIAPDIADIMADYTSIQLDIDERKIKAACLVAQRIDLTRLITKANVERCMRHDIRDSVPDADKELRDMIIAPLCYFTYSRCLTMFQGVLTDSGFIIEGENEAETRNSAKSQAKEIKGVAEALMLDVIEFLQEEDPNNDEIDESNLTPRVRVFGGKEARYNPSGGEGFNR